MESGPRIEALEAATLPLLIAPKDEQAIALARLVALITAGLAGARFALYGLDNPIGGVLLLAALGFAALPAVLEWTGDRRLAGTMMPVIGLLALTAMAMLEDGLRSEAMYWLPLVPILAAVTRGPGLATLGFAVYGVLLVGGLTAAQVLGVHPPGPAEPLAATLLRAGGLSGAVAAGGAVAWALEQAWERAAASIATEAAHHPLTGLPSRLAFDRALGAALARGERSEQPVAVAYIDLDRFKQVNDELGHAAGDRMLVEVGRRLRAATRAGEAPFHLAGDEFAVVLEGVPPWEVQTTAERLSQALGRFQAGPLEVTASLGIARRLPGEPASSLVARADHAMYTVKQGGGGAAAPAGSGAWQWVPKDDVEVTAG